MPPYLLVDGPNNRAAVMNKTLPASPFADTSFTTPLAHLADCKWHSDLDYLGIIPAATMTGTIDLDPSSAGWSVGVKIIGAHGQSFTPVLMGFVTVAGIDLPITGDFIVQGGAGNLGRSQLCNVRADATNISMVIGGLDGGLFVSTFPVTYTIYVCNMGIDASGNLVRPTLNSGFEAGVSRVKSGRYDTNFGYFNKDPAGRLQLYRGKSIDIQVGSPANVSGSYCTLGYTQSLGAYLANYYGTYPATNNVGGSTTPATFPGTLNFPADTPIFTPTTVTLSADLPAGGAGLDMDSGEIKFGNTLDTNKNTFLITDYVHNTVTLPARSVSGSGAVTVQTITNVGAVNALATDVIGLVKVTFRDLANDPPTTVVRSIGGTYLNEIYAFHMTNAAGWYAGNAGGASLLAAARYFWFEVVGGQLQIVSWLMCPQATAPFKAVTIEVFALVGTFDY